MAKQIHDIKKLLEHYQQGICTDEELAIIERWYLEWEPEPFDLLGKELESDLKTIQNSLPKKQPSKRFYYQIAAAAVFISLLSVSFYFIRSFDQNNTKKKQFTTAQQKVILPGGNKAILTLANGKTILLDSVTKGAVLQESGIHISKTADGILVYQVADLKGQKQLAFNTIATPKGGQYQVLLPDGTMVWLNAASQLRFPVAFIGKERKVELIGEGYFEVAKDKDKPFKVITASQEIEVFGTHFNVSAYGNEDLTKTTLLEGKVRIKKGTALAWLKPGQQALNSTKSNFLKVNEVKDLSESIAWKNNLFMFDQEDIYTIMNKISRWYDVEIDYKEDMMGKTYSGNISKFQDVTEVLKTMELTGTIHFKIIGRRILVMP
jgi:transmembrane sensor